MAKPIDYRFASVAARPDFLVSSGKVARTNVELRSWRESCHAPEWRRPADLKSRRHSRHPLMAAILQQTGHVYDNLGILYPNHSPRSPQAKHSSDRLLRRALPPRRLFVVRLSRRPTVPCMVVLLVRRCNSRGCLLARLVAIAAPTGRWDPLGQVGLDSAPLQWGSDRHLAGVVKCTSSSIPR